MKQLTPTQLAAFQTLQSLASGSGVSATTEQAEEGTESEGEARGWHHEVCATCAPHRLLVWTVAH
eukprot:5606266-Amphidinium_carterae.1